MKIKRDLDGVYFRIKRNEKFENICFSDLEEEEAIAILKEKTLEYNASLIEILLEELKKLTAYIKKENLPEDKEQIDKLALVVGSLLNDAGGLFGIIKSRKDDEENG